jgi:predicted SAM-dependent methyltransferase
MDPATNPDFVANLETDKLPIEDSTVEEVKAHHVLEHIGAGFFHLMQELYRVCKHGAIIDIQVPHHRSEVWYGDPSHVRFITIDNMRHFNKRYNDWHISQWNSSSGFGNRLDVDFEIVDFEFVPDTVWANRFKEMTQEQIEEVSRNFNNVYNETHIKLMVIKNEGY